MILINDTHHQWHSSMSSFMLINDSQYDMNILILLISNNNTHQWHSLTIINMIINMIMIMITTSSSTWSWSPSPSIWSWPSLTTNHNTSPFPSSSPLSPSFPTHYPHVPHRRSFSRMTQTHGQVHDACAFLLVRPRLRHGHTHCCDDGCYLPHVG